MPQIPRYEPGQVSQQPTQAPAVRNLPNSLVRAQGAQGQALAGVGSTLFDIGLNEQRKADDTQLIGAVRGLTDWEVNTVDKPGEGALSKQGKDALGLPDTVLPGFDTARGTIESGLNDRVKTRFRAIADGRRSDVERKIYSHVSKQSDLMLAAETEAAQVSSLNAIAANYKDPQRVAAESDLLGLMVESSLDRMGASAAVKKAKREELTAVVQGTLLDKMLSEREYPEALAFFEANKGSLGVKADEYAAKVNQARLALAETTETDRILATHGVGPSAYTAARDIKDPIVRERVESRLDQTQARIERDASIRERNVRQGVTAAIESAPIGAPLDKIITPATRAALATQPGAIKAAEDRITQRIKGQEVVTKPPVYDMLDRMSRDPARKQEFMTADLSKFDYDLAPGDRETFAKRQKDLSDPAKSAQFATESDQINNAYDVLGVSQSGKQGRTTRTQFDQQYQAEKRAYVQQFNREPDAEARKKIIDSLMLPFAKRTTFLGIPSGTDQVRSFQINPAEADRITVPDADRTLIIEAYQSRTGKMPTQDQVMQAYVRKNASQ